MAVTPDGALRRPRRSYRRSGWAIFVVAAVIAFSAHNIWMGWRGATEREQRHEAWAVAKIAKFSAIEEGPPGNSRLFVRPAKGNVIYEGTAVQCSLTNSPYIWKVPPPSGSAIPLDTETEDDQIFFACSERANADGFRSFVFPAPVHQRILRDQDVDWDHQRVK